MSKNKKKYIIPIIGFFLMIMISSLLLQLPICSKHEINYIDTLFETTSAISATGSTVTNLSDQYTFFGQFLLFIYMELGAIGFILVFSILFMMKNKKIKLSETLFLGNEVNTNHYNEIKNKLRQIVKYTIIIELIGTWLLSIRFIPRLGFFKGIWYSIFHSASAFCNVGLDLFGANSLTAFSNDVYINMVFIILMFLGSLGFFVLEDFVDHFYNGSKAKFHTESKLILSVSILIISAGGVLIKIYDPSLTVWQSIFTVITAKNTGLYTVNISDLSSVSQFIITIIMFIGGGPGSNAGGIRVVVFAILILATIADMSNSEEVVVFYKSISNTIVKKAVSIFVIDMTIVIVGVLLLCATDGINAFDSLFYITSSFSNTGLTTIDASSLTFAGKCISVFIMYLGRIAPITFISLFIPEDKKKRGIKYPQMDLVL